jgi:hypothetical protein
MFEGSKLPLRVWFLAMQLISQAKNNVAALELRRQLGVSYPTAWLMKHKLMESMRLREQDRQLSGRVEVDDAYLGGERSGGKPGRGSENKVPFVIALQTVRGGAPHLLCMAQLPFRRTAIAEFAAAHLVRPLTAVSDGLDRLRAAAGHSVHERIVSGGGKPARSCRSSSGSTPCWTASRPPSPAPVMPSRAGCTRQVAWPSCSSGSVAAISWTECGLECSTRW